MAVIRRTVDLTKVYYRCDTMERGVASEIVLYGNYSKPRAERYLKRHLSASFIRDNFSIVKIETWSEARKMSVSQFRNYSELVSKTNIVTQVY